MKHDNNDFFLNTDNAKKDTLNMEIATWTIALFDDLKAKRAPIEKIWQEVSNYVRPERSINYSDRKEIYDSTAILSAEFLVAGIWSLISNSSLNWFHLHEKDISKNLDEYKREKLQLWINQADTLMKSMLNNANSGFYYKSYEFYSDLICFGTAVFYIAENIEDNNIIYNSNTLADTYLHKIYEDVDCVIKKIDLTTKQAVDFFGINKLSKDIVKDYQEGKDTVFTFLHICLPAKYFKDQKLLIKNMKYSSYYIDMLSKEVVLASGYYEFPYMIARWYTNSNQIYGQSPAMIALPDIKMINAMSKTMLIAAQKQVDPPILAPSEAVIQGIKAIPGGIIYGGIDPLNGNQLLKPLMIAGEISSAYELQEQRRNMIKDAFYNSLLLYAYSSNATATEVNSINEQKLRILGSKIARIQGEFLYPLLKRQLGIMFRLKLLPQLPEGLDFHDLNFDITFINSWNKNQKIVESSGMGIINDFINKIREFNPDIVNKVNWEQMLQFIAEANSVPKSIFKY